jgi:hypothetical protein
MPYIAILNKQKRHFFLYKNREQKGKTGPVWGMGTRGKEEGGCKERL